MTKCLFCENTPPDILIPRRDLYGKVNVLKCPECGLVFLESRDGTDQADPEEKAYWDNPDQKEVYLKEGIHETFVREFKKRLVRMENDLNVGAQFIAPCLDGQTNGQGVINHAPTILDVGCGVGHFLDAARKKGWDVAGLDISPVAAQAAQEAYGIQVRVGTFEENSYPDGSFDAVTLWDVIEHIRRPIENMKATNRLLRMGGILVMKTPNEASLYKLLARTAYRILGSKASSLVNYVYYVPHYFSYTRKTMRQLLAASGFEVIRFELDETPIDFAEEKINIHYKKNAGRKWLVKLLPLAQLAARLVRRQNKLVVYARKVKAL